MDEISRKIENVRSGKSEVELFNKLRPPEEFGDSVELYFDEKKQLFRALVVDPELDIVYSEEQLQTLEEVHSFIVRAIK